MTKDVFELAKSLRLNLGGVFEVTREQAERVEQHVCAHVSDDAGRRELMEMLFSPTHDYRVDERGRHVHGRL